MPHVYNSIFFKKFKCKKSGLLLGRPLNASVFVLYYLSHSPITGSREPIRTTVSASMLPSSRVSSA